MGVWLDELNKVMDVGDVRSVMELADYFQETNEGWAKWDRTSLRSCIRKKLKNAAKFGLYEKVEGSDPVSWRRLA